MLIILCYIPNKRITMNKTIIIVAVNIGGNTDTIPSKKRLLNRTM